MVKNKSQTATKKQACNVPREGLSGLREIHYPEKVSSMVQFPYASVGARNVERETNL